MAKHVPQGRIRRFARLASVAARTTGDLLAAEAKKRFLGRDEEAVETLLEPTAERLVAVLGELKGAATKLGQFISLVDQDTFPKEARRVLSQLLSQTPNRMSYETAGEMVAQELGAPPEELFASFSPEPFASASMGQVHAATLPDGRDVVVKIQFPGVSGSIEQDLKNIRFVAKGLSLGGGALDGRAYVEEIGQTLRRELDYQEEQRQLEEYRRAASPWPELVVPRVIEERTAERVITLERLRGPTVLAFSEDPQRTPEERFHVARQLVVAVWGPFLRERLIHADPHPGNYVVLPDGRLGVLDFGATKRLSTTFTLAYWRLVREVLAGRTPALVPALLEAGFTILGDRDRAETWLQELAEIVDRPVRRPHYDWGDCEIAIDCRSHMLRHMATALRIKAPTESIMFYRACAGVAGDFRLLRAAGDFRSAVRELADRAESTLAPELREAAPDLFGDGSEG